MTRCLWFRSAPFPHFFRSIEEYFEEHKDNEPHVTVVSQQDCAPLIQNVSYIDEVIGYKPARFTYRDLKKLPDLQVMDKSYDEVLIPCNNSTGEGYGEIIKFAGKVGHSTRLYLISGKWSSSGFWRYRYGRVQDVLRSVWATVTAGLIGLGVTVTKPLIQGSE